MNPAEFERTPPHDIEAEQIALGSMMWDARVLAEVLEIIQPGDCYREGHKAVHGAILRLHERGSRPARSPSGSSWSAAGNSVAPSTRPT